MKRVFIIFAVIICSVSLLAAQKKPLDLAAFDSWKSIGVTKMSQDGKYILSVVSAPAADGYVMQTNVLNGSSVTINRGKNPTITFDSKYGICTIIQKKKAEDIPKDTLCIWTLGQANYKKFPNVPSYTMAKEGSLAVAFKGEGTNLMLYYFATGNIDTLKYVTDYAFNKTGTELFIIRKHSAKENSPVQDGLYLYNLVTKKEQTLLTGPRKARFSLPVSDKDEQFFAFYANLDTTKAAEKLINIYFFKKDDTKATLMADANVKGLPKDWIISPNGSLAINKEGTRLFFGIAPKPLEKDTTLIDFETAKLDVWHYLDDYVQSQQLAQLQEDLRISYLSYLPIQSPQSGLIQLATPDYPSVQVPNDYNADWGYAVGDKPYQIEYQWKITDTPVDLYIISIADGSAKKIITGKTDDFFNGYSVSPQANYVCWYETSQRAWFSYESATGNIRNLTGNIGVNFYDESHDMPALPSAYGSGGWRENDAAFFVYDKYDVWEVDPSGAKAPVMLTDGLGRKQQYTFRMLKLTNDASERTGVKPKEMLYFTVYDNVTKSKGFCCKDQRKKQAQIQSLILDGHSYQQLRHSKDGEALIFVRENFTESPNLWITRDLFKTQTQLSDVNSQQKEYNWGTAELVSWTSANGTPCDGILYKPEDFDPSKKYPMIVEFYERRSGGLLRYITPELSRSLMNITYAVSNGYIVFTPDIYYTIGHPGQSAVDCIMTGVEMLCKNPWVDDKNMAIQGHSWGGYQICYLVTQTNRFKVAYTSAGTSNLTSAYGCVRLGSGIVDQYYTEIYQGRIGKNLWDGLGLYIENSPIFHAPNITTPLLMQSNDQDGAVHWHQGIEYFTALRRLGKQVWMLNYNGEGHGLRERKNQIDLTIRLAQFYDHFLKGASAPVWLKEGVPATKKGIDWGLGYDSGK